MENTEEFNQHTPPSWDSRQRAAERKKKSRRRWVIHWLRIIRIYILSGILLGLLLEFLAFKFGCRLWPLLSSKLEYGMIPVGITIVGKHFWPLDSKGEDKIPIKRPPGMEVLAHIKILAKHLITDCILQNTILIVYVALAFLLVVPAYAADHQWGQRLKDWAFTPAVRDGVAEDPPALPNDTPGDDAQDTVSTDGAEKDSRQSGNEPEAAATEESPASSQLISAKDLLLNAEKPEMLSEEEYDQIFFSSGEYIIEDWTSESCVRSAIYAFVEDKFAIQSSPNYDMVGISQPVQDSIALASQKEANTKTATELIEVINIRKNAYGEPREGEKEADTSYLLAKLLRENYGVYGDAFNFQEASDIAAYALYGRSLLWGFKTLNYASKPDEFCKDLEIIAERYEKITEVVPANSQEFLCAGLLRDAFSNEAAECFNHCKNISIIAIPNDNALTT